MNGSLSDLRILVAEDNEINQRMVSSMLSRLDITADFVSNGRNAVDQVLSSTYDIVLMDMMMPGMNGLDATREIRRRQTGERAHIIALTANASGEHRTECLQAGMDDYLAKPFTKQALEALIRKVYRSGHAPEIDRSRFNAFRASLGPDSDEFVTGLIGDFLTEANRFRSEIHAGLNESNADAVRRAAHTRSSNSRTFGAEKLASTCRDIERLATEERLEDISPIVEGFDRQIEHTCDELRALTPTSGPAVS